MTILSNIGLQSTRRATGIVPPAADSNAAASLGHIGAPTIPAIYSRLGYRTPEKRPGCPSMKYVEAVNSRRGIAP